MFGQSDNQAVMSSPTAQNPSMLDNVSSQDFQTTGQQQSTPQSDATTMPNPDPVQQPQLQHVMTTDNPFVQTATQDPVAPMTQPHLDPTFMPMPDDSSSPSGPVNPPIVTPDEPQVQPSFVASSSDDQASTDASTPVDQEKLAGMKQEALAHLEPLADHIDGTPEERFKTTMMMIQANDNHTLLEKALEAAKAIEDDKARAQAMLDIINEINYFSQQ